MSLLTRKQRKMGQKTTAKTLTTQGRKKVRRILSLQNCQVGLTQSKTQLLANGNVIASMKVIRYGLSFKAIQRKRNFMVLIEFANS